MGKGVHLYKFHGPITINILQPKGWY